MISLTLFNHFVSNCPVPDNDLTSYVDYFTVLASSPRIEVAEAEATRLMSMLMRLAERKELSIAPQSPP